jgi:hypothetical protein
MATWTYREVKQITQHRWASLSSGVNTCDPHLLHEVRCQPCVFTPHLKEAPLCGVVRSTSRPRSQCRPAFASCRRCCRPALRSHLPAIHCHATAVNEWLKRSHRTLESKIRPAQPPNTTNTHAPELQGPGQPRPKEFLWQPCDGTV